MEFGKSNWRTYEQGINKEWLLTNGIGGFASSTLIGANSRRYHGLLVASLKPPVNRHLILSKLDESIEIDGHTYNLYSHETPEGKIEGFLNLQRVEINHIPTYFYSIRDVFIEKSICMVYGENTVAVIYKINNGNSNSRLRVTPLVNFRNYHENSSRDYLRFEREICSNGIILKPYNYDLDIKISCSINNYINNIGENEGLAFIKKNDCYFERMDYAVERERGLYSIEDHYIPGYFDISLKPGEEKLITFIASIEKEIKFYDGITIIDNEMQRVGELVKLADCKDIFSKTLVVAADNFIVRRESTGAKTIIAGYPWFTDWGRDTMIAFTGITLCTKRFQDAREILLTFSKYVKDGLLPNMFPDVGQEPGYNSVDAPLWYFEAVNKYIDYTNDSNFILENIYDTLLEIIESFIKGTKFKIFMDKDYLISAGDENYQLTWMDAKIGDWVVTPRYGKAVEINALWYNALMVMDRISSYLPENNCKYRVIAKKARESFISLFWNGDGEYLYDVVTLNFKDNKIRPNQIMAISLTFPVVEGEKAKKIVQKLWNELYTSYGLRTLSMSAPEYVGVYEGDQYKRDSSYHQGTVWTWPLGYFITGFLKAYGYTEGNIQIAKKFIKPFEDHLKDAGIGSISEIFDGNEPLIPRGCFAQAWSVGEILRAYTEDILKVDDGQ